MAGVSGTVMSDRARSSSHAPTGRWGTMRPLSASHASSYHVTDATASWSAPSTARAAAALRRSGSAEDQWTAWVSSSTVLN